MMRKLFSFFIACLCLHIGSAQFINFDRDGQQIVRFSTSGDAVDAHDGEIACFDGVYYLYGTSYDCGFEWGNKRAPFCGFKVYSSKDLKSWTYRGSLFDATTKKWQCRCDGSTYGCFRPHVVFNKKTQKYVLWVNVYDNQVGYRVFTATSPTGPFVEAPEPTLVVNKDMPAKGLNNGDHDLFIDDNGTAYLAFTDWRTKGSIVIEQLSDDYLTGTGKYVKDVTSGATEAPAMFRRGDRYYVLYSDPNCGYCGGTGTSYKTAPAPLGPWSSGKKISSNSCGGQPSFVSVMNYNSKKIYVYGSDLWNNAAKNEALANYFWTPLTFDAHGDINAIDCSNKVMDASGKLTNARPGTFEESSANCDISKGSQHMQVLSFTGTGTLREMSITIFKKDYPEADLVVEFYKANGANRPIGEPLYVKKISPATLGWSPKVVSLPLMLPVKSKEKLCVVLKSATARGCYGAIYSRDDAKMPGLYYSKDDGKTFKPAPGRILKRSLKLTLTGKR